MRVGTLTAWTRTDDAVLVYSAPTTGADELIVAPMGVLAAVDGAGDDLVEVSVEPKLAGTARWADRGVPRAHPFDAASPVKPHCPPDPPAAWHPVPAAFLSALDGCGRAAAKAGTRFALHRVQVQGKAGRVVGTDGATALLWGGFALPFAEDLLVPAIPAFGARELATAGEVRVGRTATHLVVAAGPWRVYLLVDAGGRFPDVAALVPKSAPTVGGIDNIDAADLLAALPGLPGGADECRPVTLALDGGVVVRAKDETTGGVETLRLDRSTAAGPPAAVAVDRRFLARALALGCTTIRVAPGRPVVFAGGDKTLLVVALDPGMAVGPPDSSPVDAAATPTPMTTAPEPERRTAVKPPASNGHPPNGHLPADPPDPSPVDPPDPLAAAEDLRQALADAAGKAGRLVAALKHARREKKALSAVWAGLKQLNLGGEGAR